MRPSIAAAAPITEQPRTDGLVDVAFSVNGERKKLSLDPRVTLLDALRERLNLTGTKKGCDRGQCGACTVHVDDRRVLSCLTLAVSLQDKKVTTIEGIADGDELHPVQQAFINHDGFQCGFCTSGQIMSAVAVVGDGTVRTDDEIREAMSGNICRCGAYPNILDAIKQAQAGRS
ncbi:(2Fe-2S)-binding protein [Lentzea sp. NBRC 105346]|uniref:(2Fe-2S)-binding protein n=1 Tax=Lentzea sp. NBRC 105346 TaxID=3032205 RepID=UPI0025550B47|nr:(2Fe-2S)-binding protein [Lentzea sp. NBRC 105346]